ncbi:class I SAM-dependent methyltransferase [Dermabacter vaginalis]|uniref:Class I SAM-dependent methyltransferase n=1 Tax=Dermabacter vaginalis TaxID=1630135 RepID=A0ABX6A4R3_9MICO|nr:class I SAM-dependent methyltransferase [Dermabacter vaginalis]QEU11783.1 class I SAM-dependent methyltransferase [Dermabacter vaginalis]
MPSLPIIPTNSASNSRGKSQWTRNLERNPGHSEWYIARWERMREAGKDLDGEARLIDALAPREARILDAGSGTGRVGAELARRGHDVVGIDLDPTLVAYAAQTSPGPQWIAGDLADACDLLGESALASFDVIVAAGNVVSFIAESDRRRVLENFARLMRPGGRLVAGFGTARGYSLESYVADASAAGFAAPQVYSTWDLRPASDDPGFAVVISPMGAHE